MKCALNVRLVLVASVLFVVRLTVGQTSEQEERCFDGGRSLSCDIPLSWGNDVGDTNLICLQIERDIKVYTGKSASLVKKAEDVAIHQEALSFLYVTDVMCGYAIQSYHKCWWCAKYHADVDDNFCMLETCGKPAEVDDQVNVTATCEELEQLYEKFGTGARPASYDLCHRAEQSSYQCPFYCDIPYLGADTKAKKRALIWMSRVSSLLSFLGASFIMYDVASNPKNRKTVYHQLIFAMAVFDIFTALAWAFSTSPVPSDKFWVLGAHGTEATCKTQAFFVELGFTSIFYNTSLAAYYLLVIVYSWKEYMLQKIRLYLHGIPLAIGFLLAFAGIPFYDWFEYGCHLLPPPSGEMSIVLIFAVLPLGISIASILIMMSFLYYKVHAKTQASRRWSLGKGSAGALETQVFYQSLWYMLSFLVSWPILFSMYLASVDVDGPYGVTITLAFAAPLQGFNNFLVYVRPKINHWRKVKYLEKKKKQRLSSLTNSGYNITTQMTSTASITERRTSEMTSTHEQGKSMSVSWSENVKESVVSTVEDVDQNDEDLKMEDFVDPSVKIAIVSAKTKEEAVADEKKDSHLLGVIEETAAEKEGQSNANDSGLGTQEQYEGEIS